MYIASYYYIDTTTNKYEERDPKTNCIRHSIAASSSLPIELVFKSDNAHSKIQLNAAKIIGGESNRSEIREQGIKANIETGILSSNN